MANEARRAACGSIGKGLAAAVAVTLPGMALIALAAVYANPGDGVILTLNQALKLTAIFAGVWTAVGPGGTRGFATGAVIGIVYIALGYGVCAAWDGLQVTGAMLALEFLMGMLLGGVSGALTANLPAPKRRRRRTA